MTLSLLSELEEALQIAVLLTAIILSVRYARRTEKNIYLIFYAMAMAAFLCSDIFWFTHINLREGVRVPFAPDDIADFGLFLLMGSAVNSAMERRGTIPGLIIATGLFSAANVGLWIAWSGEWLRDIFGGLPFGYFIYTVVWAMTVSKALRRWEWTVLSLISGVIIVVQILAIVGPVGTRAFMDSFGYVLLFAVMAWLFILAVTSLFGRNADKAFSLCFAALTWTTVTMYMSSGVVYDVAANMTTAGLVLTLLGVRKKVTQA